MNKKRMIFVFLTVAVLTTFVFCMASPANAATFQEELINVLEEDDIDSLLGNPFTWLFGALYLVIVTIITLVSTIFGSIVAAILAVISAFIGIFVAIFNAISSLF